MKDLSLSSNRHHRTSSQNLYLKKRQSPNGIVKKCKPAHRRTPSSARATALKERQRQAHILALRREGIFLEEEYRGEVRKYMHEMELFTMCSPSSMDQQPEIKWHMRPCLVEFLIEIHFMFRLRPETLYLTLNIIDRYVSRRIVYTKHYQLVGCAALWIAAKFEDAKERVPTVQELSEICGHTYEETAFIQMEGHLLQTVGWVIGHPTAEAWLRLYCCEDSVIEDTKVQHVARFLMETTLLYREFVAYPPSSIAHGSLILARSLCGKGRRIYEETDEGIEVAELLDDRIARHTHDISTTLVKKYSYAFYSKAATFTLQLYLEGVRFERTPFILLPPPSTPVRPSGYHVATPMSTTSSASSVDDMMPLTPCHDVYSNPAIKVSSDKENQPSYFEPVLHKRYQEPPEQFLPHDFVQFGRQALQSLNVASPQMPQMVL